MQNDMTFERFSEIVEAYGAAAHRWPMRERDAALALVQSRADARALVDEALALDLMLDTAPVADQPSPLLIERIMAARPRAVPAAAASRPAAPEVGFWTSLVRDIWPYGSGAVPAGALAASIMLGIGFGSFIPNTMSSLGATTTTTASTSSSDVGEHLVSMALAENTYSEEWQ